MAVLKTRSNIPLQQWQRKMETDRGLQAPIGNFAGFAAKLVVDLDGGQHAEDRAACEERRIDWLISQGFTVRRFWNADVFRSTDYVLEEIGKDLSAVPAPQPSPTWREGA